MKTSPLSRKYLRRSTFRFYDARVTAITKTLASGLVSIHTAKRLFGHVSEAMQKRYYKPDLDTIRKAVNLLDGKPAEAKPPIAPPPAAPTPVILVTVKKRCSAAISPALSSSAFMETLAANEALVDHCTFRHE